MCLTISQNDCNAKPSELASMTLDLATLQPILPLGARVLFLCLNAATLPGAPITLKSLHCPKGTTLGYTSMSPDYPECPPLICLAVVFNEFNISIMNSNFISSLRFYSSLLPSELTPPSFVPKVTITDLAPYSCHCELEEGRAHVLWAAILSLA